MDHLQRQGDPRRERGGRALTGRAAVLVLALGIAATGFVFGTSVAQGGDFEQLYAAARGLWAGVSPYDVTGQGVILSEQLDLPEAPALLPFAYPPWYALLAAPLGLLPFGPAGRVFLLWNCALLGGSLFLLTRGRPDVERLAIGVGAALYVPVLGQMAVGQHTLPVLLGAAVAVRGGSPLVGATGFWLLSLKPHLGLPIAAAVAVPLLRSGHWQPLGWGVGLLAVSAAASFAVAPGWLVDWPRSVLALAATETLQRCDTCSGLPRLISDAAGGGRTVLTVGMLAAATGLAAWRGLLTSSERAAAAGCAAAVCCLPYVRNYDGVLVVAPLVLILGGSSELRMRLLVAVAWVLPWVGVSNRELSGWTTGASAVLAFGALLLAARRGP